MYKQRLAESVKLKITEIKIDCVPFRVQAIDKMMMMVLMMMMMMMIAFT